MCGRFIQASSGEVLAERFSLSLPSDYSPRYNVAPNQPVLALRAAPDGGDREWAWLRWGLVPSWSPEPRSKYSTINARAETVADKPAYRQAFRQRRCLIPADGFYEWRKIDSRKQPYCIGLVEGELFAFAGLWERWEREGLTSVGFLMSHLHTLVMVSYQGRWARRARVLGNRGRKVAADDY